MTLPPPDRHFARGRGRHVTAVRWIAGIALLAAAFAIRLALGQALNDNPEPDGARTYVRTLKPLPLAPAPRTVTVTVTRR